MNAFTNYLEKLGSNFLVSAMIPSLAFVVFSILIFDPVLRIVEAFKDPQGTQQLIGLGLIVFIFTVIIGYTLTALNTYILKIFEGYIDIPPIRFLYNKGQRIYREKARSLMAQRESLEKEYQKLNKNAANDPAVKDRLAAILARHHDIALEYDQNYPADLQDILPTRFGNTLKAAEDHALQRYGFDGVNFWPRLIHVIPDNYKATIDNTRNELSFLVNMAILSLIFSLLCIIPIAQVMLTTEVVSGDTAIFGYIVANSLKYLGIFAGGLIVAGFFYNASLISLNSFTLTVRSSFDLFRLDLLRKLEVIRPENFDEEFDTWTNLNELVLLGNQSLTFQPFDFREEISD